MKDHEAPGGKYANGVIVRQYRPGQVIRVTSHITANHAGFVDFKLCRNNNLLQDPTQDCFDLPEASLSVVEAGHVRFGECQLTEFWVELTRAQGSVRSTNQSSSKLSP